MSDSVTGPPAEQLPPMEVDPARLGTLLRRQMMFEASSSAVAFTLFTVAACLIIFRDSFGDAGFVAIVPGVAMLVVGVVCGARALKFGLRLMKGAGR